MRGQTCGWFFIKIYRVRGKAAKKSVARAARGRYDIFDIAGFGERTLLWMTAIRCRGKSHEF